MASRALKSTSWRAERGAELIEFALVLPLLLLVLFGIIDFGLMFQRYHVVTNAAREGARVAVLPGYSDEDIETRVNQFLSAAGLTETATVPAPTRTPTPIGSHCVMVVGVTVGYPYSYSAVGTFAAYFDGSGFSASGLQATATMRSELSPGTCP